MRRICSFTDFYSMHLDYVRQGAWIFTDFSFAWGNPAPSGAMKSVTHPRVNKIREKIKSVASVLSVIHFERVRKSPKALEHCDYLWSFIHHHVLITSRRTDQDASGTVFQTAFLLAFIIPRLRPGLLSLCSVLSSRQNYLQQTTKHRQPNTNNLSLYIFIYWYFIPQQSDLDNCWASSII